MRFIAASLAVSVLVACATPAPTAPATEQAPAAAPSRAALLLAAAGRADSPRLGEIEQALGAPDIERREGAGVALTYRLDTCALLLLFAADGRNEMRLTEAHASARRPDEPAPALEQCAAEADVRRR